VSGLFAFFRSEDRAARRGPISGAERFRRLYVLVASFVGLVFLFQAAPAVDSAFGQMHWDLNVDQLTARAVLDGYNPFTPAGVVRSGLSQVGPAGTGHPPTTFVWFLPLARMSVHQAGAILGWATILLLLLELASILTLLRCPAPLVTAWLAACFVLSCSFLKYHIVVGQISGLIGFLYFVAWVAGRSRGDWLAGTALGVACTLKAFPGLMVLLFLVALRWRAVLAAILVYLAVFVAVTARLGLASWRYFLAQQAPIADLWMGSIQNQSIHGIVFRWFRPVCEAHGPVLRKATILSTLIGLGLVFAGIWLVRRIVRGAGFDVAYALFVVLSMVTSQWTWEHYTIIYVLPVSILCAALVAWWRSGRHRQGAAAMLILAGAVVASWAISINTKVELQGAVYNGASSQHVRLHVYDVLSWAPGLALLGMLYVACGWAASARSHVSRTDRNSASAT
jgi:hypothetical protein